VYITVDPPAGGQDYPDVPLFWDHNTSRTVYSRRSASVRDFFYWGEDIARQMHVAGVSEPIRWREVVAERRIYRADEQQQHQPTRGQDTFDHQPHRSRQEHRDRRYKDRHPKTTEQRAHTWRNGARRVKL
jgi:hypothetical protein